MLAVFGGADGEDRNAKAVEYRYHTAFSLLVTLKNLCSKLHCQRVLVQLSFHIKLTDPGLALTRVLTQERVSAGLPGQVLAVFGGADGEDGHAKAVER